MRIRAATITMTACLGAAAASEASETLEVLITTPDGLRYQSHQELGKTFEAYDSGAISGPSAIREYSAIRCDSAWGAIKYRIPLASGPGYQLEAEGETLRLRLVEHSVMSENVNIAAMEVHCFDSGPKPVMNALGEVILERGSAHTQSLQLANGYQVEFRYEPNGSGDRLATGNGETGVSDGASQQADSGLPASDEG